MRTAIVVSGNLRTFFMPTREDPSQRLCDLFSKHIVEHNKADVFAFTDLNDFYLDGTQYFATDKKIEVLNNDTSRLLEKIDFIDEAHLDDARNEITKQFEAVANLKSLVIERPFDMSQNPKLEPLLAANIKGNNPILLLQQTRKTKKAYDLLQLYEKHYGHYDVVLRWRFDNSVNGAFDFAAYDLKNYDVYVPGIHSPVIYDWFALGTRVGIHRCLSVYDSVGEFINEKMFICSKCEYYGQDNLHKCAQDNEVHDISLSVEYHLFRVFKDNNIRLCNATYQSCPYRYKAQSSNIPIEEFMKNLNIDASVVSYSPGIQIHETHYTKRSS